MYCQSCGATNLPEGARFCPNCGSNELAAGDAPPPMPETPAPPVVPVAPTSATSETPPPPMPPPPVANAGGSPRAPLLIAGGVVAAIVVAALVFFVVLKKDGAAKNTIDPARADELSAAAIIGVRDIPGSGWALTSADDFTSDDADNAGPDTPACNAADAIRGPVEERLDAARAGRAKREFDARSQGANVDRSVGITVVVYKNANEIEGAFETLRSFLASSDTLQCIEDRFKDQVGDLASGFTITRVDPSSTVPEGGAAAAFELSFQVQGTTFKQRLENYSWPLGNAVAEIDLSGPPADITSQLVAGLIEKQDARIKLAGSDSPPSAEPVAISSPPAPTSTTGTVRTPTPAATRSTTSGGPTPTPGAGGAPSGTGGSTPAGLSKLSDLTSYRYTLKIEGNGAFLTEAFSGLGTSPDEQNLAFEASGAYVKPDRGQQTIKFGSILTVNVITIGQQQWAGVAGMYGPANAAPREATDYSLATSFWDAGLIESASTFSCTGARETVNGIMTRTCGIDQNTFAQLQDLLGGIAGTGDSGVQDFSNVSFQIWIAEPGGYLVRLRADIAGTDATGRQFRMHIETDITDVNSPAVRVDPPAP